MKKLIAVFCLLALILAGCASQTAPDDEQGVTDSETTVEETTTVPAAEQVIQTGESALTGHWEGIMDKGQYVALLYFLQTGGDEEYAMTWLGYMEDVTYPLTVTIDLNEDSSYTYTVQADEDQKGLEEFAVSLYNGMVGYFADINDSSEEAAKDYMADNGTALWDINSKIKELHLDLLYANPTVMTGTWEHNDHGLFLSGWCTVQFNEADGVMEWTDSDDLEMVSDLPLTFHKQ